MNNFSGGKSDDSASARGWVFFEGTGARLQRTNQIIDIIDPFKCAIYCCTSYKIGSIFKVKLSFKLGDQMTFF